ncbi:hypothetical protein [Aestuariivirga sp.]|uniref:hypothetical protein n=1 Tax=Aestuariivirga sp. TaxID=2650926 RepID=UPI0039E4FF94
MSPASGHEGKRLLVLVQAAGRQSFEDFLEIAREIVKLDPGILVHIVTPQDTADIVPAYKWRLPSLTVSFSDTKRFVPPRGPLLANRPIKKQDQHARFAALGIATPFTERFSFGTAYREDCFGPLAVLKTLPLGKSSFANSLQLFRTRKLAELRPPDFPETHFLRQAPALVQQFIDTGPNPAYYRVLALFGEPLLWMKVFSPIPRVSLEASDEDIERIAVDPRMGAVARAFDAADGISYDVPDDVIAFARRMTTAFPSIPLQACDILTEHGTGKHYAIEINAGGNTWDFSSQRVAAGIGIFGGREGLIARYDPWPRAARALVTQVRERAF